MEIKYVLFSYLLALLLNACSPSKKTQSIASEKRIDTLINNDTANNNETLTKNITRPADIILKPDPAKTDSMMLDLLEKHPGYFDSILQHRKEWNVQIIYTQVNRDRHNNP